LSCLICLYEYTTRGLDKIRIEINVKRIVLFDVRMLALNDSCIIIRPKIRKSMLKIIFVILLLNFFTNVSELIDGNIANINPIVVIIRNGFPLCER